VIVGGRSDAGEAVTVSLPPREMRVGAEADAASDPRAE